MRNSMIFMTLAMLFVSLSAAAQNDPDLNAQPLYNKNSVIANLRINVPDDTKELLVTRANTYPKVYTKAYVLKNPVAYEIRPYIRTAVSSAKRVQGSSTRVECLRYADGVEAVIVSAEDYRFLKTTYGMPLDELIEFLDKPNITSSSGQKYFLYFPKFWDATKLEARMKEMGLLSPNDDRELLEGTEQAGTDNELNGIIFFVNPGNIRSVADALAQYDKPIPEVKISYSVYQVDVENDARIGADFQAWRNGDGANIFSLSTRMRDGWDVRTGEVATTPATRHSGALTTMGLAPKWNTRYLDFLRAKGVAKAVTSGTLAIRNNQTAVIDAITSTMYIKDDVPKAKDVVSAVARLSKSFATDNTTEEGVSSLQLVDNLGRTVKLVDRSGASISDVAPEKGTVNVIRGTWDGTTKYRAVVVSGDLSFDNGSKAVDLAESVKLTVGAFDDRGNPATITVPITFEDDVSIWRDAERKTDAYAEKFALNLSASVAELATVLDFNIESATTTVGFGDRGEPRMNTLDYAGRLHVPNSGAEFMIGGIEKVVNEETTAKVPWLGDIPVLGWLLGSEGSAMRRYQMVTVLKIETSTPATAIDEKTDAKLKRLIEAAQPCEDTGIYLNYGFDQFYFDKSKTSFDPLP